MLISSCTSHNLKNQTSLEKTISKAKKNIGELSQKDWELADLKMEKFKEDFELKKDQMTKEERDKANELIGRYYAIRVKGYGIELKETISDFGKQMEGAMKELSDTTNK